MSLCGDTSSLEIKTSLY